MKQVYRSKISFAFIIPLGVLIFGILILMLVQGAWPGVLIIIVVLAFITHLVFTTYYVVDGNKLHVKSGFIINITIDITTITKIEPVNTVMSAPALSFDRLEVFYNKYDSVVISPGDKAGFIKRLKEINPEIIIP